MKYREEEDVRTTIDDAAIEAKSSTSTIMIYNTVIEFDTPTTNNIIDNKSITFVITCATEEEFDNVITYIEVEEEESRDITSDNRIIPCIITTPSVKSRTTEEAEGEE